MCSIVSQRSQPIAALIPTTFAQFRLRIFAIRTDIFGLLVKYTHSPHSLKRKKVAEPNARDKRNREIVGLCNSGENNWGVFTYHASRRV
jgi:hypothetical protein